MFSHRVAQRVSQIGKDRRDLSLQTLAPIRQNQTPAGPHEQIFADVTGKRPQLVTYRTRGDPELIGSGLDRTMPCHCLEILQRPQDARVLFKGSSWQLHGRLR